MYFFLVKLEINHKYFNNCTAYLYNAYLKFGTFTDLRMARLIYI